MKFPERLSYEEIEAKATSLLLKFGEGQIPPPPIPVQRIMEDYLGLTLVFANPAEFGLPPSVLGAIYFDDKEVFVNEQLLKIEGRLNFTLGHETGHDQMHRDVVDPMNYIRPLLKMAKSGPGVICRDGDRSPIEWQADVYSACLLMPQLHLREAVRTEATRHGIWHDGLRYVYSPSEVSSFLDALADTFQVSREAMRIRLKEVDLAIAGAPRQATFGV